MRSIEIRHPTSRFFVPDAYVVEQAVMWYTNGFRGISLTQVYQTIIDLMLAGF